MERGEVWWAMVDEKCPIVILSLVGASDIRTMLIVPPATVDEKRGFVVMSGEEALRSVPESGLAIEVAFGAAVGLPETGVVRVGVPAAGARVPCTWLVTLTRDSLIEQAGTLSRAKLDELDNALRLAGID